MGMSARLYPLTDGDKDETKVWDPLGLGMRMEMNFFYKNKYGIVKPVIAPSRPIMMLMHEQAIGYVWPNMTQMKNDYLCNFNN